MRDNMKETKDMIGMNWLTNEQLKDVAIINMATTKNTPIDILITIKELTKHI